MDGAVMKFDQVLCDAETQAHARLGISRGRNQDEWVEQP
jgi:hypothetical protein